MPKAASDKLFGELGAGAGVDEPAAEVHAGNEAFVYALQSGLRLAAAFAFAGAVLAWVLIAKKLPQRAPADVRVPVAGEAFRFDTRRSPRSTGRPSAVEA